ncbi:transcriptional regulator, Fur family [Campylobacter pinnipediorum subsp. caledonicus]|uniref:Ferric uptake regulation protein n=1 Tax=Campylobacter pinnipediorum subsp. caledonicus TaxID=1874362 RepID=A0A1S6U8Z5_9BACT|nr:Fur family transcriptional regulator [Campylobacter pinnipediorum]AQW86518.1 transcriptional regulator, Fur family [Campylobacter pinnipediorum subsp. caledonicus]AQW88170.1 transcriptional regulator, Fur family [Campylobacter pinnipediorum subsp. caledonicus]OPA71606.1 transcriptional repressor [Campylobacter pinnipediorum subsp. caledonicus]
MDKFDKIYKSFSELLSDLNYKNSYIKEKILNILYVSNAHLNAVDIQDIFKKQYKEQISLTTIYSFLNFLTECNLVNVYNKNNIREYELNLSSHHDHLICEKCNKIITFFDEDIEKRQHIVSGDNKFNLIGHTMILYGICKKCQNIKKY